MLDLSCICLYLFQHSGHTFKPIDNEYDEHVRKVMDDLGLLKRRHTELISLVQDVVCSSLFHLSLGLLSNLVFQYLFDFKTSLLPKQPRKSRSVLQDRSRLLGVFWKGKDNLYQN